jgi:bifunctional DNase/RNase
MPPPSRWKARLACKRWDARSSDALNLAALVQAPILVAPEVLVEPEARRTGDSPEAARLRKARVELAGAGVDESGGSRQ